MSLKYLSAIAVALALVAGPSAAIAADPGTSVLRQAVTPDNVFKHQGDLEAIADANGGTATRARRDTRRPSTTS